MLLSRHYASGPSLLWVREDAVAAFDAWLQAPPVLNGGS